MFLFQNTLLVIYVTGITRTVRVVHTVAALTTGEAATRMEVVLMAAVAPTVHMGLPVQAHMERADFRQP